MTTHEAYCVIILNTEEFCPSCGEWCYSRCHPGTTLLSQENEKLEITHLCANCGRIKYVMPTIN